MSDTLPSTTDIQIASDASFSNILINNSTIYCTSQTIAQDALPYGTNLYARVRHHHPETGVSNWSNANMFNIIAPANIIGVCLDNSTTIGTFHWIDKDGNSVSVFDYKTHPVFMGIGQSTFDTDRNAAIMTKFPLFYIKTAVSGPVGTYAAGKKCWWISDLPETGFRPVSAFKRSTKKDANGKYILAPFCYIGTYNGLAIQLSTTFESWVIGSARNTAVSTALNKSTFRVWSKNRNNTSLGLSGFRMFDIYDTSILKILILIMKADPDLQSRAINTVATSKTGTTACSITFNALRPSFIHDLWSCYWCMMDLIKVPSGVVQLTSPMDLSSDLSFGDAIASRYTQATGAGYIKDVLDCPFVIGDDTHDLKEFFLPKTLSASQSTFKDYSVFYPQDQPESYCACGGSPVTRSGSWPSDGPGLFAHCANEYSTDSSDVCARLAKH